MAANIRSEDVLEKAILKIQGKGKMKGMVCQGCADKVLGEILKVPGVLRARVDLKESQAYVEFERGKVGIPELRMAVKRAGFVALPIRD